MTRLRTALVLLALALLPTAALADRTFTMRLIDEPETLDWNRAHTTVETHLLLNLMEGLVQFDDNMKVVPQLAKSWSISPDGKTYTFKLRNDVKWSDGVPLRAKDFVFSWKRLLSPLTAAAYGYFLFDVEGAEAYNKGTLKDFDAVGIKALDDFTLQVKLAKPVAHWISIPTFWVTFPLREDIVAKHGAGWEKPGRMVTVGPYVLVSHDYDSKIVLKPNPHYYGKRGNIDQIVGLIIRDASTAMSLYEAGKVDFLTDLPSLDLKRLAGNPELKSYPYLKTVYLGLVTEKYPTSNTKVRRAISMAIDKSKFGQILYGHQEAAGSFVPPKVLAHSKSIGLPYDPTKAKHELQSAGIDLSRGLSIELTINQSEKSLTIGQYIQDQLKKNLGVTVTLQPFDHKTFRAQLDLRAYPMFITSWSADYPDPDNFLSIFLSTAGNNRFGWKNVKFDEQIMKARGLLDSNARDKVYRDAQKLVLETDATMVPLFYEPNMALVKQRVKGLVLNPINYLLLRNVNVN